MSRTVLDKFPDMLSAQMIGRLLPEIHTHEYIRYVVNNINFTVSILSVGFVAFYTLLIPSMIMF